MKSGQLRKHAHKLTIQTLIKWNKPPLHWSQCLLLFQAFFFFNANVDFSPLPPRVVVDDYSVGSLNQICNVIKYSVFLISDGIYTSLFTMFSIIYFIKETIQQHIVQDMISDIKSWISFSCYWRTICQICHECSVLQGWKRKQRWQWSRYSTLLPNMDNQRNENGFSNRKYWRQGVSYFVLLTRWRQFGEYSWLFMKGY